MTSRELALHTLATTWLTSGCPLPDGLSRGTLLAVLEQLGAARGTLEMFEENRLQAVPVHGSQPITREVVRRAETVGDSHRFKSKRGEISLLYPCSFTGDAFEIYCITGGLFDDVERYETEVEALRRIDSLLC